MEEEADDDATVRWSSAQPKLMDGKA